MTELLIIKAEEQYYKCTDGQFEPCAMNKASVFPLSQLEVARSNCLALQEKGVPAILKKLIITEEPFVE